MALSFTSDARPPSNTQLLPNRFLRPAFGELYGFDADADSGVTIDGALTTELSEPLTAENGDILQFEPASGASPAFNNTYSVSFDGTDDKMQAGDSTTIASASVFTISAWARFHGTGQNFLASGTANQDRIYMELVNTKVAVVVKNGSGGAARWTTSLSANTWYHIACTVDSGTSKLFVNGVYRATASVATLSATAGDDLSIGTDNGNGMSAFAFDGDVDEVSLFSSALSDGGGLSIGDTAGGDIATLYNSGLPADISSLSPTSWWRMGDNNSGSGTTITDQGSEGNDGTLVNGPTFSTTVPS